MSGRGKKGRRELKGNGAPVLLVREIVTRWQITEMPRRVSRRCTELGITYGEIAQRMGVSRPRVSFLTNRGTMSREFFRRLCDALELEETDSRWFTPLPEIMTAEDGAQKIIAKARERSKKWARES